MSTKLILFLALVLFHPLVGMCSSGENGSVEDDTVFQPAPFTLSSNDLSASKTSIFDSKDEGLAASYDGRLGFDDLAFERAGKTFISMMPILIPDPSMSYAARYWVEPIDQHFSIRIPETGIITPNIIVRKIK